ncbi:transcriptional regulator, LacI family [Pseudonocardia oroxyli]|uniref:Transcriptional regulator, LacI family n=1 Tax=Pseudonocardia oroxyli TaxID=366584 RepID=A0A1G7P7R6_PSEOR|nr:transcriptional regulator, LacI family [Pseudonocardia oroxyli]
MGTDVDSVKGHTNARADEDIRRVDPTIGDLIVMQALPIGAYAAPVSAPTERAVNLADVARLAGVSPATASRALGGHPHVAAATRERVRRVADELSYVVSPDASRLAGGRTGRVAALVPHLDRWYFAALLDGLAGALRSAGLDLLVRCVGGAADRAEQLQRMPGRRVVDAVVALAFEVDGWDGADVPLVTVGGPPSTVPFVTIDDLAAGRQAMDHLIHLGHRRIAMIEALDPDQRSEEPVGRRVAYEQALAQAGLPQDQDLVATVDWGGVEGADAMARLLGLRHPPTAVYAHSDEVALGAIRTLRRAGLRIPDDVSVIGVDDHPLAELTDLTTVRQPVREQGALAGHMVATALSGGDPGPGIVLPTQLVVRGSTAPPREERR